MNIAQSRVPSYQAQQIEMFRQELQRRVHVYHKLGPPIEIPKVDMAIIWAAKHAAKTAMAELASTFGLEDVEILKILAFTFPKVEGISDENHGRMTAIASQNRSGQIYLHIECGMRYMEGKEFGPRQWSELSEEEEAVYIAMVQTGAWMLLKKRLN